MKHYLGIDVGSVSLKIAIIDENKKLVKGIYLKNSGIIKTMKEAMQEIKHSSQDIQISGVGVTGSGREFASYLVGGDAVKTEILAHCEATLSYYPDVRTIIDIGGEDAKIIVLEDGIWTNYAMNSICSAGTGSIIESVARILGVSIEDVGKVASTSSNKLIFPAKCGVLIQSAVITKKNRGALKEDILMGVCRAVVNNYLLLAKNIEIKTPIVFQGMTSKNKGLIKAFEEELNQKIIVNEHGELMGAIGSAILSMNTIKTNFKGFELSDNFNTKTMIAKGCENQCELTLLMDKDKLMGVIGNRCERCKIVK